MNKLAFFLLLFSLGFSQSITLEAEDGVLTGVTVGTSVTGYLGSGYVTGMDNAGDKVTVNANVTTAGSYSLQFRYNADSYKEQLLLVNSSPVGKTTFPATSGFETVNAGGVFLNAGSNTITLEKDWGWIDLDQVILTSAPVHDYNVTALLTDSAASPETVALWNYLKNRYGQNVLSGQNSYWDQLVTLVGTTPKIRSFDFQNYSNSNPWGNGSTVFQGWDDGTTQSILDWASSTGGCGIVTVQWHWFSPMGGSLGTSTFRTDQTNFDVRQAVIPGTAEYTATLTDIDTIASQLRKLADQNIPILWRPLHEAGGAWFWWGAQGAAPALALWDLLYDRLTNFHGLHNLIWVWSTPEADWYPGNGKLDVFGFDSYPGAFNYGSQKVMFDQLWNISGGEKILALTENGPIPDIAPLFDQDARWAYFVSWDDLVSSQNSTQHITDVYSNSNVVNLDESGCLDSPVSFEKGPTSVSQDWYSWNGHVLEIRLPENITGELRFFDLSGKEIRPPHFFASNSGRVKLDLKSERFLGPVWMRVSAGNRVGVLMSY